MAEAKSDLVSVKSAMIYLGRGKVFLWYMRREGALKTVKVGRRIFFELDELKRFAESNQLAPNGN